MNQDCPDSLSMNISVHESGLASTHAASMLMINVHGYGSASVHGARKPIDRLYELEPVPVKDNWNDNCWFSTGFTA